MGILTPGEQLNPTYTVERFLGEGAFAEVYRVQHKFLGRQAMKVMKNACEDPEEIESMLHEALVLSKIGHPNIIRVFDANVLKARDGLHGYFTMEFVPGGTLDRHWRSYGSSLMPVQEAVELIRQAASGLALAHSETPPIVHRDIKPQNLLVGFEGTGLRLRVSDFGLAKQVNPMTLLLSAKGTLGFKPPEAFDNLDSCASDVWALSTVLYLLLTDTMPYPELEDARFLRSKTSLATLRPPSIFNVRVDDVLDEIVLIGLSPTIEHRYSNAKYFLNALNSWMPAKEKQQSEISASTFGESSKAVSEHSQDKITAQRKIAEAMKASRQSGKLSQAADLLEEAISVDDSLSEDYGAILQTWRRGVLM